MKARSLEGKVALVTGGTRGIGLAIAEALLAEGARVVIAGSRTSSVESAGARLGSQERWMGVVADLAQRDAPAHAVASAVSRFGRLDVLVNNAGVAGPTDLWQIDAAEWDRIHAINLRAAFFCAREAATVMRDAGRGGSIVNISSVAGQIGGAATGPAYVASKAGMIGLTRSLARHFAAFGVRVNGIAPADVDTDMTASWPDELRKRLIGMTPLGRFAQSDEVAAVAVFLAGHGASFITGQTLNVNGGLYMG